MLKAVVRSFLSKGSEVLMTSWAMKLKYNGTPRGRHNARGYEHVNGSHYVSDNIVTPVLNPITVQIMVMLYCMNPTLASAILNVEGTFHQERFENGKDLYI